LICGLVPAWQATRGDLNQMLREGGRGALGNAKGNRLRGALVVIEVALSLIVLIGAGLIVKSFNRLLGVDTGFKAENLLTVNLPLLEFKTPQQRAKAMRAALTRVVQLPGVQLASSGSALPPVNAFRETRFAVQGIPSDNNRLRSAYFIAIGENYFRTLGTTLHEGREFSDRDDIDAAQVVIVNRALAHVLFANESALGKRLQLVNSEQSNEWREIVGVVGEVRYAGLNDTTEAAIYTPFAQTPFPWANLVIRTSVPPLSLTQSVSSAVKFAEPVLKPGDFRTMEQLVSDSVSQPRFYTTLLGTFALLALALAAIGIYGVIAYSVAQRTHEIGVRMAVGADARAVLRLVIQQGMRLALLGIGLGLVGAFALTRVLKTLLYGVSAADPRTFAGITFLLMLVALLACWIPARRATKVDPLIALRHE
jgi:putative ABC transport system permease protein